MKQSAILYPVFALVAWTFLVLLRMAVLRFDTALRPLDFVLGESDQVPLKAKLANRNYMNLLELPLLFYVACILIYVGKSVPVAAVLFAWAYVLLRVVHSLIHISYNNVIHRFLSFGASNFALAGLWIVIWTQLAASEI